MEKSLTEMYGEIIDKYTRKDMLADGSLVDVSVQAKQKGFRYPVAITEAVHLLAKREDKCRKTSYSRALNAILDTLHTKIKFSHSTEDTLYFSVKIYSPQKYWFCLEDLKAIVGPGDDMEPVMTIMLAEENED